jgi:hypothetical protein
MESEGVQINIFFPLQYYYTLHKREKGKLSNFTNRLTKSAFELATDYFMDHPNLIEEYQEIISYGLENNLISPKGPKVFVNGKINPLNSEQINSLQESSKLIEISNQRRKVDWPKLKDWQAEI